MTKRMAIAALAFAGIFLAAYLTLYKLGIIGQLACTVGECETVNLSRWARFIGLPVAAWGIGFYVVLFTVAMAGVSDRYGDVPWIATALLVLTGWGVVFSAWLTYLELFVIRAICLYCVVSAVLVTIAFVVSLMDWRERRALAMED
jgi:uncharacterized membrane protein